jgi:hypothetical protein
MYPATFLRSASGQCIQSRTEGFAPLQIQTLHDCPGVSARKLCFGRASARYRSQNHSVMPLDDLEACGRDSGSSGHASNSGDEPKTPQYDTDTNATEAESNDDRSEAQKFDAI